MWSWVDTMATDRLVAQNSAVGGWGRRFFAIAAASLNFCHRPKKWGHHRGRWQPQVLSVARLRGRGLGPSDTSIFKLSAEQYVP
jgi:hypothetical protein